MASKSLTESCTAPHVRPGSVRRHRRTLTLLLVLAGLALNPVRLLAQAGQPDLPVTSADYVVGAEDVLAVSVWNQPSLTGKFTILADGTLNFPLIGHIDAGGLTIGQIEELLTKRLAEGYVNEPHVTVTIEQYRSQQIFITGEVKQPGAYPLTKRATLLECLARAGSTTDRAGSEVIIYRKPASRSQASTAAAPDGTATVVRVDLSELQSGVLTGNVELRDGDTILVPKAEVVFVLGQVNSPGAYPIRKGMTILQALAVAGGLTERGSDRKVRVVRTYRGERIEISATPRDIVQAGDTVVVGERVF
jgi:polysaccharide biosynthesis/export protein